MFRIIKRCDQGYGKWGMMRYKTGDNPCGYDIIIGSCPWLYFLLHASISWFRTLGWCAIHVYDNHPKLILKSNFAKSRSSVASVFIIQSSWSVAQRTIISLPCSGQHLKTILQLRHVLSANKMSRDRSLRWVLEGYPMPHSYPGLVPQLIQNIIMDPSGTHQHIPRWWWRDCDALNSIFFTDTSFT